MRGENTKETGGYEVHRPPVSKVRCLGGLLRGRKLAAVCAVLPDEGRSVDEECPEGAGEHQAEREDGDRDDHWCHVGAGAVPNSISATSGFCSLSAAIASTMKLALAVRTIER